MPSGAPQSPLSLLSVQLQGTTVLAQVKVLLGARSLAAQGAPPRIVLFPQEGTYEGPLHVDTALRDVQLKVAARCWGRDLDGAWDVRNRLFEALDEITLLSSGGVFWRALSETWDDIPDGNKQGQELQVLFTARFAVERVPPHLGEVDAISITQGS